MVEVLSRNQLEDRVTQVLEPLVIRGPAFRVLVVVGAMGQGLSQKGRLVEPHAERPLQLL